MKASWEDVERYRTQRPPHLISIPGDPYGAFLIPFKGVVLAVIANAANPDSAWWDHASVSLKNRTPNWYEMDHIKDLFWREDETVMQLHVPKSQHRCIHPHCLHLWAPTREAIPLPPSELV
jgi:hypothetical protein